MCARIRVSLDAKVRLNLFYADKVYTIYFTRTKYTQYTYHPQNMSNINYTLYTHTHAHHAYVLNAHT